MSFTFKVFILVSLLCLGTSKGSSNKERAHTNLCPLGVTGPGEDLFLLEPKPLSADLFLSGRCSSIQFLEEGVPTCCQGKYFDEAQKTPMSDPFGTSAQKILVDEDISDSCINKLSAFTCGLCRTHQDTFVQNYTGFSEVRLCLSYCQDLLGACAGDTVRVPGEEMDSIAAIGYEDDPARFCSDLFDDVENIQVSISLDVEDFGDSSSQFWRSHCFSDARECDESDFEAFYSECDLENDVRSVHYKYKEDSLCRGGTPLPDPVLNLPCHQSCQIGHHLPIGSPECIICPAGTHSLAGHYVDQFDKWPSDMKFATYCEANNGTTYHPLQRLDWISCGWVSNNTFIESGHRVHNSQNSVLELSFNLVRDGSIGFEYKVLSESYDGLLFFVDDQVLMSRTAFVPSWELIEFDLSAGFHTAKWLYFKDLVDSSETVDLAMVNKIIVDGSKWASSECELCSPGHYSNAGQALCTSCPSNKYAPEEGLSECRPCPETHYSIIGADECTERLPCTENDVSVFHKECVDGFRLEYVKANEPVLCDRSTLDELIPENQTVACADCNPGFYRPEGEGDCLVCDAGTISERPGATECDECPAGTYAPKTILYTQFENWSELDGLETDCDGECGSEGWRLLGDDIDTGVGHGVVDVFLNLSFHLEEEGLFQWSYTYDCSNWCYHELIGRSFNMYYYWFTGSWNRLFSGTHRWNGRIPPGDHNIQWIFSKPTSSSSSAFDRFVIHNITITGVSSGGAVYCANCPGGSFSEPLSEYCSECPRGTFSKEGARECSPCGNETYSNETGATSCKPCPSGTISSDDGTDCDHQECTYSPIEGVVYDLSPLAEESSHVPVLDKLGHEFFLNPCDREPLREKCWDRNNKPISTYGCQLLPEPYNYTMDLGQMLGYYPLENSDLVDDPVREGLVMTFTEGTYGCGNWRTEEPERPRTTNITFICNPKAGRGAPIAVEPVEDPPCVYNFRWPSAYACPRCTIDNYNDFYGPCIGEMQTKSYVPKIPHRCTGGATPVAEQVPCVISYVECPPGQYLSVVNSSENVTCVDASPGHYSIGGGYVFDQFDNYTSMEPPLFNNGSWLMLGDFIRSGNGDTEFSMKVFLLKAGEVRFRYKVFAPLLDFDEPGFRFFVNNNSVFRSRSTDYGYMDYNYSLSSGEHKLQWRFTGGSVPTTKNRGNYAVVDKIEIVGVIYAARNHIQCRGGTFQLAPGQTSCLPCPPNTRSSSGASSCSSCDASEYSFQGSASCETKKRCEARDFVLRYSDCVDGKQIQTYQFLEPQFCQLDSFPFEENRNEVLCGECPLGYPKNKEGNCKPCPLGFFYKKSSQSCEPSPKGSVVLLTHTYFPTSNEGYFPPGSDFGKLPEGFATVSDTPGTVGWRILNNSLGSGYHSVVESDSILSLDVELLHEGSIDFQYTLSPLREEEVEENEDTMLDGVQFFINGEVQIDNEMVYHPENNVWHHPSFKLEYSNNGSTPYQFKWVYHQPFGSRQRNRIILSDIRVIGDSRGTSLATDQCERGTYSAGGATACELCDVGHYADQLGMGKCLQCPENTFTNQKGTPECEGCGIGTNSSADGTTCDLSICAFWHRNNWFNLSSLSQHVHFQDSHFRYELSICNLIPKKLSSCYDENKKHMETYSCGFDRDLGVSQDLGRIANVRYQLNGEETSLQLQYNRGYSCGNNQNAHTNVNFVCDLNVYDPAGKIRVVSRDNCTVNVEWRNAAACRVCDVANGDYLEQSATCKDNIQSVTYIKSANCYGDVVISEEKTGCSETYPVSFAIVFGSVVLLVILVGVIVFVILRNKNLADRYEHLVNESQRNSGPPKDFVAE